MYRYNEGGPCPVCEGALKQNFKNKNFKYKNEHLVIENYPSFKCQKCGEEFLDEKTIKEFEPMIRDFQRKVNGLLTSEEIKAIRKKLHITQEKLAQLLGVSRLTINRYENGQQTQTISQDIHFRMLKDYPVVLKALSPNSSIDSVMSEKATYDLKPKTDALSYKEKFILSSKENKVA